VARSVRGLLDWFEAGLSDTPPANWTLAGTHHPATLRRFYRRLRRIVYEDAGVLRMEEGDANPLDVRQLPTDQPAVVDLSSLADSHLQRFVAATLFKQAADDQTGPTALRGMHYLFVLDELNRFAPKGASDPITKLIELVASELRSRGVILLGAQQQASLVSVRVIENASIRVLGRTGSHELRADVHGFVPTELRSFVETMAGGDKVISCPTFRQPMLVRVPRPPWAMRGPEATVDPPTFLGPDAPPVVNGPPRLRPRSYAEQRL
jgi:DNA helicase HerA-like ATPase